MYTALLLTSVSTVELVFPYSSITTMLNYNKYALILVESLIQHAQNKRMIHGLIIVDTPHRRGSLSAASYCYRECDNKCLSH